MKKFGRAGSTFATVMIAVVVLAIVSTTGAVAGSLITSKRIKNNTIKSIDVRDNNLKGVDILNGSIAGADVANGSLSSSDFTSSPAGLARGYLYSGNPDPALDTPVDLTASDYAYNSAGGTLTRTRTAVGRYTVNFAGLDLNAGNVQVTAYGSSGTWCNVSSWGGSNAYVACFDAAGSLANSAFTVTFIR